MLDEIKIKARLTSNQTKIVTGGIRANMGRSSVPSKYREHVSTSNSILSNFYNSEKVSFITNDKSEVNEFKDVWTVWANALELIKYGASGVFVGLIWTFEVFPSVRNNTV